MIELKRAELDLPPTGVTPSMAGANSSAYNASAAKQPTPAEVAAASLLSEDAQIERFLNRLERRDRKVTNAYHHNHRHHHHKESFPSMHGPTVPTALSRRMLHRQGVGYLDETIASVVSSSADRFLATVLQQSIACRDQRLKGAVMAREAAKQRKRHTQNYEEDMKDRKRRKDAIGQARETIAVHTMAVAEATRKGGPGKSSTTTIDNSSQNAKKKKRGGSKIETSSPINNNPIKLDPSIANLAMEEDEDEYDSIDEEEEYYQNNVIAITRERIILENENGLEEEEEDDDDDDDDTLLLRDIVRPLEAWNFHLNGKESIVTDDAEDANGSDVFGDNEEKEEIRDVHIAQQSTENPEQ